MTARVHHGDGRCWCGIFHMDGVERAANERDGVTGDQADKAALMLADRRHRQAYGRDVCQHCAGSWPCDARLALDACAILLDQAESLTEHVRADCGALARVWHLTRRWDERAAATPPELAHNAMILTGYAQTVRNAITDDGSTGAT